MTLACVTNRASAPPKFQHPKIAGNILPLDLLTEALSYLTPKDAWLASQTCRWWWQLLTRDDRLRAQVDRNMALLADVFQSYGRESPDGRTDILNTTWAASQGHLGPLQWMRKLGYRWDQGTLEAAAEFGHVNVLEWAHRNKCPQTLGGRVICLLAAEKGRLPALQWLVANGFDWNERTCRAAARGGQLKLLQWARENGCPWDESTCALAAKGGHLEVLQWARENGCPWDETTCACAAQPGHLAILQWAHANGCPWDESTCMLATHYGRLEVLQWASNNGCPWDAADCAYEAELKGHTAVLQWIREQMQQPQEI